ncbi:MAG: entericidin [Betaproteobacteria bacterium RIFCSPLOWO2_12_FULL_63_13]|nr:MAG: entericidin [Betaproteobacteria bacterium RIFCSPLOWO2_02_FULL_63_19]OGA53771.1 MAG: entericidin [Betaproteobacteria bacterium RIFCSPLOWO2_12_FULL_63_13]
MFRTIVAALLILSALGIIAGCNTIAGLGKDLERGGEVVQDAAKKVQKKL